MELVIAGIPAAVVVVALTEAIKKMARLEGDQAIPVALVVGLAIALGSQAAQLWPDFGQWWEVGIVGLLWGLAACGLFDLGKAAAQKLQIKK